MSTSDTGGNAEEKDLQWPARRPRKWRWVFLGLLAIIVGGAGGAYWELFTRVYQLDVFRSAMRQIKSDEQLRDELGEPIKTLIWPPPNARIESSEKDVRWEIEGPKGHAKAHVFARLTEGKWEMIQLEVTPDSGKRISLSEDGGDNEAPAFGPAAKPADETPQDEAPAPQMNFTVPAGEGPGK